MRRVSVMLAGLLLFFTATPASAHATLVSMTPAAGSTVTAAPAQVVLTFDEPMQALGSTIAVIDPTGRAVQTAELIVQGQTIAVGLLPLRTPGRYHVNFRVLSSDGHIVTDSRTFDFAPSGLATVHSSVPEVSAVRDDSTSIGFWLTGGALLLVLLLAWGVARWRAGLSRPE